VLGAEGGIGAAGGRAALGAGAKVMLTAREIIGGTGVSVILSHGLSFFVEGWPFAKNAPLETRGKLGEGVPYPGYFAKCAEALEFKRVGGNSCLKV
jgi:hypothetical protein